MSTTKKCEREFEFALIVTGITELTSRIEDALFKAGCDDATLSIQYGELYMEFSRTSPSLKDAILSAIQDVRKANIGADVLRVDDCNFVTMAEIARKIGRSRQLVHQYMTGKRGPGGFPAPICNLTEGAQLWQWCAVSFWLHQNNMIRSEELEQAEIVDAINNALDVAHQRERNPKLLAEITRAVEQK